MNVGKYTYGANGVEHIPLRGGNITIGKFCSLAKNIKIYTGRGGHRKEFISTYPFGSIYCDLFNNSDFNNLLLADEGNVTIGDDVWVGQNVTIMPGVNIGTGTIIANSSHVVKSCEPYSIIGGNPAKLVCKRFTQDQIDALLKIKWWEWDDSKINDNIPLICSRDIEAFIAKNE